MSNIANLYQDYAKYLVDLWTNKLRNHELAEDLVQTAFCKAIEHNPDIITKTYINVIIRNLAVDYYRRFKRIQFVPIEETHAASYGLPEYSDLPVPTIFQQIEAGYSQQELAIYYGITVGGVKSLIFRERHKMIKALETGNYEYAGKQKRGRKPDASKS